ncbi:hypothetical protein CALVIDRAFT_535044 [Calocera viscosa TUFC12733]|uniref:L domain-like protein n=1 Tax=Calocera viscosa (strain TUFC12733) TaxID=1330018 RepID=A0A167PM81_CALVF|nr:hypothetical protein CALVIDRAFT_535044 [Calocera viscosa TUFC12733]
MAQTEPGDEYIRRFAAFIRTHEQRLADAGFIPRTSRTQHPPSQSGYNLLSWVIPGAGSAAHARPKPTVLSIDPHHLVYLLMRMEALGLPVGDMDVRLETPLKQNAYISLLAARDRDAMSILSLRSTISAVSQLSLGPSLGWLLGPPAPPPTLESELKYMYSLMTKLPALSLHNQNRRLISELAEDPPTDTALPLDVFKNLQSLEMTDVDPRDYIGWDQLSLGLRSLTIRRSSVEDMNDVLVDAVGNDLARRKGELKAPVQNRPRFIHHASSVRSQHVLLGSDGLPHSPPPESAKHNLPSYTWMSLRHLALPDNALTFFPSAPTAYLTSLQSLDLSNNLLVSIPPCLSSLPALVALNLAQNMLDSILNVSSLVPHIRILNLSHNRLDSLCGLERLEALERADLQGNRLEESAEVGRLAQCPHISEVWVEDNTFCKTEPDWRVRCFELFRREGRDVLLDGAAPSFTESMFISPSPAAAPLHAPVPVKAATEPPAVIVTSSPPFKPQASAPKPTSPPTPATTASAKSVPPAAPHDSPRGLAPTPKKRRPPVKRVVDLDAPSSPSKAPGEASASLARHAKSTHLKASTDPPSQPHNGPQDPPQPRSVSQATPSPPPNPDAEAFRARIEALREEVGESWLRVLSQGKELGGKVVS